MGIATKLFNVVKTNIELTNKFTINDFNIEYSSSSFDEKVIIRYEYDKSYYFDLTISLKKVNNNEYRFSGKLCPSELIRVENFEFLGNSYELGGYLGKWVENIWEELISKPKTREYNLLNEEINKLKEQADKMEDDYFTNEEASMLKNRLTQLEKDFIEKISELEEDKKIKDKQIKDFKLQIETLKSTIPSLRKRGWFKSFITKMVSWASDPVNQKLLKAGKDLIVSVLPEKTA